MAVSLGVILGAVVAVLGFLLMRNPMRFASLAAGAEGYYQRLILDRLSRIWLRLLAVLVSLFGLVIFTAALSSLLKWPVLDSVSEGFLVLLWILFIGMWVSGVVVALVLLIRSRLVDWLQLWRRGIELGPIDVYPPVTPAMKREAEQFTWVFCALVGLAICGAFYFR